MPPRACERPTTLGALPVPLTQPVLRRGGAVTPILGTTANGLAPKTKMPAMPLMSADQPIQPEKATFTGQAAPSSSVASSLQPGFSSSEVNSCELAPPGTGPVGAAAAVPASDRTGYASSQEKAVDSHLLQPYRQAGGTPDQPSADANTSSSALKKVLTSQLGAEPALMQTNPTLPMLTQQAALSSYPKMAKDTDGTMTPSSPLLVKEGGATGHSGQQDFRAEPLNNPAPVNFVPPGALQEGVTVPDSTDRAASPVLARVLHPAVIPPQSSDLAAGTPKPVLGHDTDEPIATLGPPISLAPLAVPISVPGTILHSAVKTAPVLPEDGKVIQQVAASLVSVSASTSAESHDQSTILRLNPEELGKVQITIERPKDGPIKIELLVERPETLVMLQQDQSQLHRALDLAGLDVGTRAIQFHLATEAAPAHDVTSLSGTNAGTAQSPSSQSSNQGQGQGHQSTPNDWPNRKQEAAGVANWAELEAASAPLPTAALARRWNAAGINITA